MHRPTFAWTQRRTRSRSCSTTWTGTLENRLTRYRTSRNRARSCPRLSGWRSGPRWRLVHRTRSSVGNDHARRRRVRTRWRNWRRWFCCQQSRWLWRRGWRGRHRNWSLSLCHGRRRNRRMDGLRSHWHRWGGDRGRWWLGNRRRGSGKCWPGDRRRNDDSGRGNRRRGSGRWWSFHGRDGRCHR